MVAGENAGAKLEKALKLNVEIWDKARLIKELKNNLLYGTRCVILFK